MPNKESISSDKQSPQPGLGYRLTFAIVIGILVIGYTAGVVSGFIPSDHKIDSVTLTIIALTIASIVLLLNPHIIDRLRRLEAPWFKLDLDEVKAKQAQQESQLANIQLILPLLLQEAERVHLLNLGKGKTTGYKGNHAIRTELRRLRSMGLIRMRPNRHVSEMKDDLIADLGDYIELTKLGERWVEIITEMEQAQEQEP